MGLLDSFIPADAPIRGLLSDPNATMALAATLMQGTRGRTLETLGQGLLSANQVHQASQKEERASRQQEIAQLAQSYKMLKDADEQNRNAAMFEGRPYVPNPLLAQHEQRLSQLLGTNPLFGQQPTPQPMMPRPTQPQSIGGNTNAINGPASSGMPPTNPQTVLNAGGAVPARAYGDGMPQDTNGSRLLTVNANNGSPGTAPPAMPQAMPPRAVPSSVPEMLQGAGIPPAMASAWASTPEGQRALFKHLADTYGPRVVNNVLMQVQPGGGTRFLGGVVGQDVAPVTAGPNGLSVQPIAGSTQYFADRAGAITGAQEAAKARNDLVPIPQQDGTVRYVTRAQGVEQTGQPQSSSPNPAQIPPQLQAQRDAQRLQILYAERDQQRQAGQVDPNLEREISFAERGVNFAGKQQPGFTAGQTTAGRVAAETNPKLQLDFLAESYKDANKAADSLIYTDAARRAVNGQTSTGLFAKPALLAARVGAAFGISDPQAAADPEVFMAMAGRQVMGVIKNLGSGSGISDADREYAAKATGGDIRLNRESINRLLDIQERATRRLIELHNGRVDQADQKGVPNVFDYRIAPPDTTRTPVAQGPLKVNQTALYMARQAIAQGKPRDAVRQRLIEQGFSPEGL